LSPLTKFHFCFRFCWDTWCSWAKSRDYSKCVEMVSKLNNKKIKEKFFISSYNADVTSILSHKISDISDAIIFFFLTFRKLDRRTLKVCLFDRYLCFLLLVRCSEVNVSCCCSGQGRTWSARRTASSVDCTAITSPATPGPSCWMTATGCAHASDTLCSSIRSVYMQS
jgi:hypothetical protein